MQALTGEVLLRGDPAQIESNLAQGTQGTSKLELQERRKAAMCWRIHLRGPTANNALPSSTAANKACQVPPPTMHCQVPPPPPPPTKHARFHRPQCSQHPPPTSFDTAAKKPSMARRPTNSSFFLVKPAGAQCRRRMRQDPADPTSMPALPPSGGQPAAVCVLWPAAGTSSICFLTPRGLNAQEGEGVGDGVDPGAGEALGAHRQVLRGTTAQQQQQQQQQVCASCTAQHALRHSAASRGLSLTTAGMQHPLRSRDHPFLWQCAPTFWFSTLKVLPPGPTSPARPCAKMPVKIKLTAGRDRPASSTRRVCGHHWRGWFTCA